MAPRRGVGAIVCCQAMHGRKSFSDTSDDLFDLYAFQSWGLYGGFLLIITRQKKTPRF